MRECLQEEWMWMREAAGLPLSAPMSRHCRGILCLPKVLGDKAVMSWWVWQQLLGAAGFFLWGRLCLLLSGSWAASC